MLNTVAVPDTDPIAKGLTMSQATQAIPAIGHILVVEDDAALSRFLSRELTLKNFSVDVCQDGEEAFRRLQTSSYDLVIQDLNLPKMDGMELLRHAHSNRPDVPVLVLSARNRTEDLVDALEQGAHDYLNKPFSMLELMARIRMLLRRSGQTRVSSSQPVVTAAATAQLFIDKEQRRVVRGHRRVDLTPREFALLQHLMNNAGKPVSRQTLMQEVWNVPFDPTTNIVDVYMKYLRDKIDFEGEPKLIRTVRGVGYIYGNE